MLTVFTFLLTAIYVIACFFLIFVVLIQKGEGGGLGGLAGGGAVDMAFGAKADMTWKRATGVAAFIFLSLSLFLGVLQRPRSVTKDLPVKASPSPSPSASSSGAPSTPPMLPTSPIPIPTSSGTPVTVASPGSNTK